MRNAFIPDAVSSSPQTRADVPFLLPPCKYHPDTAAHSTRTSFRRASSRTDLPRRPLIVCRPFFFGSAHGSVGRTYAYIQLRRWWSRALSGTSDVDAAISSARGMHAAGLPPPSKHFAGYDLYPGSRYGHSFLASVARSNRRGGRREKRFGLLPRRGSS